MRPLGKASQLEKRRKEAVQLILEGKLTPAEAARKFKVTVRAVNWWLQWQRGEGKRSIEARKTSGRPPLLNAKQREALRTLLLKGAAAAGFDTDLWTCPRVREVIRRTFGITYHVDHVCRLLHALGFTPQKPERKAVERNEQAIRQWVSHQWPSIKKKPSKRRRPSPSSTKRAS